MVKGILEVLLIDAKGLADMDAFVKMDPYVLITYRDQERKTTVAKDGAGQGTSPRWNESFEFLVKSLGVADSQHKLILKIMDKDTFTADDFVGEATINVADVIALGLETGIGELHPAKHRVVLANGTYCGEIRVGVKFTPKVEEEDYGEELGGWSHSFRD